MVKQRGFSLVEMMMVMAIATFMIMAVGGLLNSARASFFNTDSSIDLRNSLRNSTERLALELRQSGFKAGVAQFAILAGQGAGGTDMIRFAVPIFCSATSSMLDASGNPSYWGAPLTWGCDSHTCMDANADCTTIEYRFIEYSVNASGQLERKILDGNLVAVNGGTNITGNNITGMTVTQAGNVITVTVTGQKTSAVNRTITAAYTNKILLNNTAG